MKLNEELKQLDVLIVKEKHNLAEAVHEEAWVDAASAGVEPYIIARSAIKIALQNLVTTHGEIAAHKMADEISELFNTGALINNLRLN